MPQFPPFRPSSPPPDSAVAFRRLGNPAVLKVSQAKGIGSNLLEENKVQIISNGVQRLVYVNGHQVREVLALDTPRKVGELCGRVVLTFIASEIVERTVSTEEWARLSAEVASAPLPPHQQERAG